jgi:hypothetical protein
MLPILLADRRFVGFLISNNSCASLFVLSFINSFTALITDSVFPPNGLPCHEALSSISRNI